MVTTIQEKKEPLTAKVLDMARLVEYQTGSVVSRAIIQKKTGTVTLFAFDEGQGLSEHTAPFDALVCLLDGEAEVIISGNAHVLKKGEMIIMPANEPHALKAVGPFKMMLVMIRGWRRLLKIPICCVLESSLIVHKYASLLRIRAHLGI
jgi:quercetin dioxygenase-like cupin family protein